MIRRLQYLINKAIMNDIQYLNLLNEIAIKSKFVGTIMGTIINLE